jgi:hypothetical protein
MNEQDLLKIGSAVIFMAQDIFEECGAADDFCIQNISQFGCVTFGGWNRISLTSNGWSASEYHCSPSFIEAFKKKMDKSPKEGNHEPR